MAEKNPFIIAVDFDQTLFETKWPEIGEPNLELINYLIWCRKHGDQVILWTCREGEALVDAVNACAEYNLHFDAVNRNLPQIVETFGGSDCRKVFANVYIDDLAYHTSVNSFDLGKYLLDGLRIDYYKEDKANA